MIALSRVDLRRFRLAARRCVLPGRARDMSLPIRITAEGNTVLLTAHLLDVVVALRVPAAKPESGSVVLPLADVERFEGTGPDVVTLGPIGPKKVTIAWDEGTHQRSAEFDIITTNREWPEQPEHLISLPPTFPQALHEAGRTAARESGKYAVEGVQIKGKAGQVIATDGKQALIQGGYTFPFTEDLLIPAVPFFGAKEVGEERAVSIGRSDKWLFLVIGPWQVWLAIDPEGRFPDVSGAVPRASGTRVNFTDQDAEVVLQALPRLPKEEGPEVQIVTLDLGRQVAIRASAGKEGEVVEVPLPGTECVGPAMLLVLNRVHLGRALAMGFREFRFASAERPMCTWDGPRMYLSAVLDPQCAIPRKTAPAGEDMPRAVPDRPLRPLRPNRSIPDSPERNSTMPARESPSPERNGHPEANGEALDPLAEAESLRVVLAEAHVRAGRLVTALRGFRKQHKTVTSALASLRSLRLE